MVKHEKETLGEEIGQEIRKIEKKFKLGGAEIIAIVVIAILVMVLIYNTMKITNIATGSSVLGNSILYSASASEIIPSGVPKIYGKELGISYNDISASNSQLTESTIGILAKLDNSITLTGDDLQRYIKIGTQISCEYCCGAESIIFSNGQPACGCAHSYAMRGVAKYLISKHGSEFSDDEILEELGKWKVLFFPGIHETKASALEQQGIEINYINLASNKYRGIEQGASSSGGMVGGC